jgi:tetrathionate reductase subunit B
MAKYGMVIDLGKCVGCDLCTIACNDQFIGNAYPGYNAAESETMQFWMDLKTTESGTFPNTKGAYFPLPCMHCENPPCQTAATGNAVYTRSDGIVLIDPVLAVGQQQLLQSSACPYGKIFWNPTLSLPQKCTFCAHRVDQKIMTPSCALACQTNAISFGDLDDPSSSVSKSVAAGAKPLHPEYGTKPKVYYLNLPSDTSLLP